MTIEMITHVLCGGNFTDSDQGANSAQEQLSCLSLTISADTALAATLTIPFPALYYYLLPQSSGTAL